MNNYKEDLILNYMDKEFQITVDKNPGIWTTGNGMMHTGFFYCLLHKLNLINANDIDYFDKSVINVETGLFVEPGLYSRNRGRDDLDSHDNARGIAAASKVLGKSYHRDILNYGIFHVFVYNNTNKPFFNYSKNPLNWIWGAFRGRFIFDILWYFALSTFFKCETMLHFYLNPLNNDYSAILNFLMAYSLYYENEVEWNQYFTKERKDQLIKVCIDYFKSDEHPIVGLVRML